MINKKNDNALFYMVSFLAGMVVFLLLSKFDSDKSPKVLEKTEIQLVYDINDPVSEYKIRQYLKELHVKHIDVAIAQMKLESNNANSKVYRENNNLFGLKKAEKRPTTALGTKNNHAYYSHWRQSCIDYAMYQCFSMDVENMSSQNAWLDYVDRNYATDGLYKKKLLVIINSFVKE